MSSGQADCIAKERNETLLLVAGLNNSVESLSPLAQRLQACGYQVKRLTLSNSTSADGGLAADWANALKQSYADIKNTQPAEHSISVIAYSTGALLSQNAAFLEEAINFRKQIYIAAPFELTFAASLVHVLLPFKFLPISLPARTPRPYREKDSTSLKTYAALFEVREETFNAFEKTTLPDRSTLFIFNPRDELVAFRQSTTLIANQHKSRWTVYSDFPEATAGYPNHLMIAEEFLSSAQGQKLFNKMLDFLEGPA